MMKKRPVIFVVVFLAVTVVAGPTFGGVIGNTDMAVRTIAELSTPLGSSFFRKVPPVTSSSNQSLP